MNPACVKATRPNPPPRLCASALDIVDSAKANNTTNNKPIFLKLFNDALNLNLKIARFMIFIFVLTF
jgi:hypothetical protein